MIEIQGGITIGNGIVIGDVPVFLDTYFFVTQDGLDNLVSENNEPFIEE